MGGGGGVAFFRDVSWARLFLFLHTTTTTTTVVWEDDDGGHLFPFLLLGWGGGGSACHGLFRGGQHTRHHAGKEMPRLAPFFLFLGERVGSTTFFCPSSWEVEDLVGGMGGWVPSHGQRAGLLLLLLLRLLHPFSSDGSDGEGRRKSCPRRMSLCRRDRRGRGGQGVYIRWKEFELGLELPKHLLHVIQRHR